MAPPAETLLQAARKHLTDLRLADSVAEAVQEAIGSAAPDDVICIAGSLYVVGEAMETFEKNPALLGAGGAGP